MCLCSIVINTEQRQEDGGVIFCLNHDRVVIYCSALSDDKAIVSAFRLCIYIMFNMSAIVWTYNGLTVQSERTLLPALTPCTVCILICFLYFIQLNLHLDL